MASASEVEGAIREAYGSCSAPLCSLRALRRTATSVKVNQEISMQALFRQAPSSNLSLDNLSRLLTDEHKEISTCGSSSPRLLCSSAAWKWT